MQGSSSPDGPRNWTLRVLAPLALIATTLVAVVIISSSIDGSDSGSDEPDRADAQDGCQVSDEQAVEDGFYVLEAGEDLSDVADKTCIEVERLVELNPNLDPLQLPIGGCVDLVFEGCKALAAETES